MSIVLRDHGRHVPASHPLRRSGWVREVLGNEAAMRAAQEALDSQRARVVEWLDEIAVLVAALPDGPSLTNQQRRLCGVLAAELHRLGREPRQVDHERYYRQPVNPETEERYAAMAGAVKAGRPMKEIAAEFDVSTQLVSRVAIARGVRRRMRTAQAAIPNQED